MAGLVQPAFGEQSAYEAVDRASRGIKGAGELSKRHSRLVDYFFENTRDPIDVRRNDAAPDDVEAKKSSSLAKFAGIFPHDRAIDRSMQGR